MFTDIRGFLGPRGSEGRDEHSVDKPFCDFTGVSIASGPKSGGDKPAEGGR